MSLMLTYMSHVSYADIHESCLLHTDRDKWSSNQKCYMLDKILELIEGDKTKTFKDATLQNMQAIYDLSSVVNSEIRFRW